MSRRRKETNKTNMEIARINPSLIKIITDRTTLHIESKTILDKLIKEIPERARHLYPWSTNNRYISFYEIKQFL